jgi:C1A family cysteine protease
MKIDPRTIIDASQDITVNRTPPKPIVTKKQSFESLGKYQWKPGKGDPSAPVYQLNESVQASLSATVDLRQYCSPIDDQGNLGSCTGNAIAGAIDLLDRKTHNLQTRVSRLFIYYYERLIENDVNYDAGAYIHDGITVGRTYGAPQETLWPYNISAYRTRPSNTAIADAARRKITQYQSIANFTVMKNALASGYPVIVGFNVYSSFEGSVNNNTGMMPYPNTRTESLLGGHAVCVVGYNDTLNGGRFICRNSWGTSWGNNGYFYMPYQVIQNTSMSSDFWAIMAVNDPTN